MITWIFAVDEGWNIGYQGDMIYWVQKDLRRFRQLTWGKAMLMGRRTFEALPGVLENREHYVLTSREDFNVEGVTVLRNKAEALDAIRNKEAFLIGGAKVASDFLEETKDAYITEIKATGKDFDTSLPNLSTHGYHVLWRTPLYREGELSFSYAYYTREPAEDFTLKREEGEEITYRALMDDRDMGTCTVHENWILSLEAKEDHLAEKLLCEVLHQLVEDYDVIHAKRENQRRPFILMGFDDEEVEDQYILRIKT